VYDVTESGSPTLEQTRAHNAANEITDITVEDAGAAIPGFDAAGNMTALPGVN
jgi:hypothetical protein